MGNQIYSRRDFIIFKSGTGFVVYNKSKKFEEGHTHLKNFNAAKKAVNYVIIKKIPKKASFYYLESLIRLSNNQKYVKQVRELMEVRKQKGSKEYYININKGVVK